MRIVHMSSKTLYFILLKNPRESYHCGIVAWPLFLKVRRPCYLGGTILDVEYGLVLVQLGPERHILHLNTGQTLKKNSQIQFLKMV